MERLPSHLRQKDKSLYKTLSPAGSANYERLYMSGRAINPGESSPRGIPADDFNTFATMVYAFSENRAALKSIQSSRPVRHVDIGSGPSLYPTIASLPYVDEVITVDISPANVERLQTVAEGEVAPAPHWQAWLEIAAILHDVGGAEQLIAFDQEHPELYNKLRHWPLLSKEDRDVVRANIYQFINIPLFPHNPYQDLDLQSELQKKLRPRVGDMIDEIDSSKDLEGTADIVTSVFFSESCDGNLEVVAHAETNAKQVARKGGIVVSAHISETSGYTGFFTPEELQASPEILSELPATPGLFHVLEGELVDTSDKYSVLWNNLTEGDDDRKMVRPGLSYGSAVIVYGRVKDSQYNNGAELVTSLKDQLRVVTAQAGEKIFTMYCTRDEVDAVVRKMQTYTEGALVVTIESPKPIRTAFD